MTVPAEKIPDDLVEAARRRIVGASDTALRDMLAAVFEELEFPPDFFDLPEELDVCRPVELDGETIRVRGEEPLTEEGQAAFTSVVRAAKRRMEAEKAAERAEIERKVRAKVAEEIEAVRRPIRGSAMPDFADAAYVHAARIARGDQ
jgi:hypothetical protein